MVFRYKCLNDYSTVKNHAVLPHSPVMKLRYKWRDKYSFLVEWEINRNNSRCIFNVILKTECSCVLTLFYMHSWYWNKQMNAPFVVRFCCLSPLVESQVNTTAPCSEVLYSAVCYQWCQRIKCCFLPCTPTECLGM